MSVHQQKAEYLAQKEASSLLAAFRRESIRWKFLQNSYIPHLIESQSIVQRYSRYVKDMSVNVQLIGAYEIRTAFRELIIISRTLVCGDTEVIERHSEPCLLGTVYECIIETRNEFPSVVREF